ncbi:MAG: hypothetical protein WDN24_08620 [Sphingomonas sp.]
MVAAVTVVAGVATIWEVWLRSALTSRNRSHSPTRHVPTPPSAAEAVVRISREVPRAAAVVNDDLKVALKLALQKYVRTGRIWSTFVDLGVRFGRDSIVRAADGGNVDALFLLAMVTMNGPLYDGSLDIEKATIDAIALFQKGAALHDPGATGITALLYDGEHFEVNRQLSRTLITNAIATNDPRALLAYAEMLERGKCGIDEDLSEAERVYLRAIAQGSSYAKLCLGQLYRSKFGREEEGLRLIDEAAFDDVIDAKVEKVKLEVSKDDRPLDWLIGYKFGKKMTEIGKSYIEEIIGDRDLTRYDRDQLGNWLKTVE